MTTAVSGMVEPGVPLGTHLFMGPPGTGKTHLVRSLALTLHGSEERLAVATCNPPAGGEDWLPFAGQFVSLFVCETVENRRTVLAARPLSLLLIEHLERASQATVRALVASLESGRLPLPEGRMATLENTLVILTTNLCSREILDSGTPGIGFAAPAEECEEQHEVVRKVCRQAAKKHWGQEFLAQLDDFVVFRALGEDDLLSILERANRRLNHRLSTLGLSCEMLPAAQHFLLHRGVGQLKSGAKGLVKAYRRFVEFPVADLAISGSSPFGSRIVVDHHRDEEHLHFVVTRSRPHQHAAPLPFSVPIVSA